MPKRNRKQKTRKGLPQPTRALPRWLIGVFLVVYLGLASSYAFLTPIGLAPDETAHLRYVQWVAEKRSLPVFQAKPDQAGEEAGYEAHQPPLYYLLAAPGHYLFRSRPQLAPYLPRFLNILISLVVIGGAFLFVKELLPGQTWTAAGAAGFLAFIPMHLCLSASITNDLLAEAFFALTLWLLARSLRRSESGEADRGPLWIGVCCGLGILTKSLSLLLLPLAWAGMLLAAQKGPRFAGREALRRLAEVTLPALLLAAPWLIRNQLLYHDPLAAKAFLLAFADRPTPKTMMENPLAPLAPLAYFLLVISWTYASAWGAWTRVGRSGHFFLPILSVYVPLGLFCLASFAGFLKWLLRSERADWQRKMLLLSLLLSMLVLASFVHFNLRFFQAQGRYLFPALPVFAFAITIGFRSLFSAKRDSPVALLPALGLAILSGVALPLWILPEL